jgi:DNA-binding transcriptional LysR family regulator
MAGLVRGHVAIGTVTSHNVDLPGLLAGFNRDHPDVEITLTEDSSDKLIDALRGGRLDAAIIAYGTPPAGLGIHIVTDEPIAAAVGHRHKLASRTTLSLEALATHTLICLPPGTGIRSVLDRACAAAGLSPHIAFEAGTPQMLAQLAAAGLGVAVLPGGLARSRDDLHTLTVTKPSLRGCLGFAWRAEGPMSPAARALIGRAREMIGSR